jgi:hypothetical protein
MFNYNNFFLMATVFGYEPRPMEVFVETHLRNDDHQKWVQQLMDSQAQKFVVSWFQQFFFLSYYYLKLTNCFFLFSKYIYTMRLPERYGDDHSTHLELDLNLWLEVGLYRNWVYSISNTRVEDKWTRRSVSTIKSLQSASSSQSLEFQLILNQQIKTRMTHLTTEIERLNAKTTELQRLYMELKLYMVVHVVHLIGPSQDPSLPPSHPPSTPLFYMNCIEND